MIKQYIPLPVTIEAIQYIPTNAEEVLDFIGDSLMEFDQQNDRIRVLTSQGESWIRLWDYVIKNSEDEVCGCRSDLFENLYEEI